LTITINHIVSENVATASAQQKYNRGVVKRVVSNVAATSKVIQVDSLEGRLSGFNRPMDPAAGRKHVTCLYCIGTSRAAIKPRVDVVKRVVDDSIALVAPVAASDT
jgi:hypothetical protein